MPTTSQQNGVEGKSSDAATNALSREKQSAPGEVPVKQHNPGDQGLNPDQRGPAQPDESDSSRQGGNP